MSRWKAFAIHLAISCAIALAVVSAMYFVWYPEPLFEAMGGNELVLLLVGVDVTLGPAVTLIIFNPAKGRRLLRMDLAVIAVAQLAALSYGVHVVAAARPVYVVFSVDRFDAVAASDLFQEDIDQARRPEFRSLPWGPPRVIAVAMPATADEQFRVIEWGAAGHDLPVFVQYYVPYPELKHLALKRSRPLADLRRQQPAQSGAIAAELAKLGRREEDTRFLPLKARRRDMAVLLDARSGDVVGYAKVNPW